MTGQHCGMILGYFKLEKSLFNFFYLVIQIPVRYGWYSLKIYVVDQIYWEYKYCFNVVHIIASKLKDVYDRIFICSYQISGSPCHIIYIKIFNRLSIKYLQSHIKKIDFRQREEGRERETETSICCSTNLCMHRLILICALTGD